MVQNASFQFGHLAKYFAASDKRLKRRTLRRDLLSNEHGETKRWYFNKRPANQLKIALLAREVYTKGLPRPARYASDDGAF